MKNFIIILLVCLIACEVACTKREEANAKKTGGAVAGLFGLPPAVGESAVSLALLAIGAIGGHKHGRARERRINRQAMKAAP